MRQIRLLVCDLDYMVFDCAALKSRALRQSLIPFADQIPQNIRLPDAVDIEEGFLDHGSRWIRSIDVGLDEPRLEELEREYRAQETRLIEAGAGKLFPGMRDFLFALRREGLSIALGADSSRNYLITVSDRHGMDEIFDIAFCAEEYGAGSIDEMLGEIMSHAEVNPSETLIMATRPAFFDAGRSVDIMSIGCGWGIQRHEALAGANFQSYSLEHVLPLLRQADELLSGIFG